VKQEIEASELQAGDTLRREWIDTHGLPRAAEWVVIKGEWVNDHPTYTYYLLDRPAKPLPTKPDSVILIRNTMGTLRSWILQGNGAWLSPSGYVHAAPEEMAEMLKDYSEDRLVIYDAKDK
jgi:hypothetical protein